MMILAVGLRGSFDRLRLDCDSLRTFRLHSGSLEDALHGSIQKGVELGIELLCCQSLDQSPRKTRDDTMIPAQARVGFVPRVTSRKCKHPHDPGMPYAFVVQIVLVRQRK